jgi:PAS domain S-box-containing protein
MKLHSSRRPAAAHARPASIVDDVRGAAVVLLDPAGHIVGWSEAAHVVLGYPAVEIVGRHLSALYPERDGHEHSAEEALRVADQSGSHTDFGPLVAKGGATVLAQRTVHALGDGHGLVRGYSALIVPQDPRAPSLARAEIERAVARARAAEGRATRILESVTDAFYSVDARWRFTYLNPVARRMLAEIHAGEPLGKTLWEVVPMLVGTRAEREYRLAVEEQRATHFVQDFADRCFELHAYPSPDGLSIYFRDVTEEHRAQARLRTLESVVTQANDAVLITEAEPLDEPGPRIVYANDSFTRMTGYQPEEYLGKSPRFLQGPATDPAVTHRVRLALDRREPISVELVNYRKDGTPFLVELIINPVFDDKRALKHFTAVQRDITERREAEQVALRLAREESARALAEDAQRRIGAILESITDAFFAVAT